MTELGILAQERMEAIRAVNQQLDGRLAGAVDAMDVESAAECFHDSTDLVVVMGGAVLRGSAELRQFLVRMLSGARRARLNIAPVARYQVDDTVFALETATYELEKLDGEKVTWEERWLDARQNVAGRWVYTVLQASQAV